MKENKSRDTLKERIKAELLEEAEEITAEVEAYKALHQYEFPEDLDRKVMERIRKVDEDRKAQEMLSEEDKEALRIGKEILVMRELEMDDEVYEDENEEDKGRVITYRRKKKPWKVYLLVAVVTVMVLAMGMTSIGGRPFILEMMDTVLGEKEMTKIDSNREGEVKNVEALTDEEKIEQKIKETFGVNFVRLGYVPSETIFYRGEINQEYKQIIMLYQCEEEIIEYQIILNYRNKSHGYDIEDEVIKEELIEVSNVPVTIKTYKLPGGEKQYIAQFEYEDAFYSINAAISEAEIKKIIKNLIFF